jgi:hypothetical protein
MLGAQRPSTNPLHLLVRRLTHHRDGKRANEQRATSVSPGTRSARPGEGDGGRHATAFPESRPTSCPAVHVPRPG